MHNRSEWNDEIGRIRHGIEIGAGLGPLQGKIWRVGLMGASCTLNHVLLFLAALEGALRDQGMKVGSGGVEAARAAAAGWLGSV